MYTLRSAKQIWEMECAYGDSKMRIQRAAKWNHYYAWLAKKSKEADSPELFTEIKPDYFVDDLIQRNNLRASDHVIDIGAGGGRYTLQFAKQCSHVTALDSCAENMNLLCSRAEMMNLHNITCRHSFWEEYQTDQIYDVSFCSMCPAICTEEDILRMEQMTERLCCLITITTGSYDEHRMRMLKELHVKPEGTLTEAIHYYNVLYLMGRQPSVITQEIWQETDQAEEEIMERYPIYFSIFGIPVDESKRYLSEYIKKHAVNGVLHEKSCYRLAMLTWKPK